MLMGHISTKLKNSMVLDLKNLESNRCPVITCGQPFLKTGVGYDRGINCSQCGHTVPIDQYKEIMRKFIRKNFIDVKEPDEE